MAGEDEESKPEDTNTGILLTPSTCQTIYDNRLKMLDESKSTVGEFEESYNEEEDFEADVGDLQDRTEGRYSDGAADLSRKKVEEEIENRSDADDEVKEKLQDKRIGVKLHSDIKLEVKMTKTLRADNGDRNELPEIVKEVGEKNFHNYSMKKFDESEAFAMSIGSQLESVDPRLRSKIEVMIFMILEEERIRYPR